MTREKDGVASARPPRLATCRQSGKGQKKKKKRRVADRERKMAASGTNFTLTPPKQRAHLPAALGEQQDSKSHRPFELWVSVNLPGPLASKPEPELVRRRPALYQVPSRGWPAGASTLHAHAHTTAHAHRATVAKWPSGKQAEAERESEAASAESAGWFPMQRGRDWTRVGMGVDASGQRARRSPILCDRARRAGSRRAPFGTEAPTHQPVSQPASCLR